MIAFIYPQQSYDAATKLLQQIYTKT